MRKENSNWIDSDSKQMQPNEFTVDIRFVLCLRVCVFFFKFSSFFSFSYSNHVIAEDRTTEQRAHCFKHLSKSASELDSRDSYTNVPQPSPSPQRSGRTVAGVLQRTHGFLSTLKVMHKKEKKKENVIALTLIDKIIIWKYNID